MFWRRTNQDFNILLVDVKNEKNNGLLAGVSLPPSSRTSRVSLAPKTPFPFPFKRLPRRLQAFEREGEGNIRARDHGRPTRSRAPNSSFNACQAGYARPKNDFVRGRCVRASSSGRFIGLSINSGKTLEIARREDNFWLAVETMFRSHSQTQKSWTAANINQNWNYNRGLAYGRISGRRLLCLLFTFGRRQGNEKGKRSAWPQIGRESALPLFRFPTTGII